MPQRKWCDVSGKEGELLQFKLLVPVAEFYKNIRWCIGVISSYGGLTEVESWYSMRDGRIVHIHIPASKALLLQHSWCDEFEYKQGVEDLSAALKVHLRRGNPIIYVAGSIPEEIRRELQGARVMETQIPI
jgi:hypothetical protein